MRDSFDLLVTHERRDEHQLVLVRGKHGKLTLNSLKLLLTLAAGRADAANSGYVGDVDVCYPVAICRLRQALQRALRSASGKAFVETGCGKEYRLKPNLTIGMTQEYAVHLRQHDADLLETLMQAGISIVPASVPHGLECASAA